MLIEKGEKVHIIERRLFAEDVRRHFLGEIVMSTELAIRIKGHVWVYDSSQANYVKRADERERAIFLDGSQVVNIVPKDVVLDEVKYKQLSGKGLVITDGKKFSLEISEFSAYR